MTKEFSPQFFNKGNQYHFYGIDAQSYFLLRHGLKSAVRVGFNQYPSRDFLRAWRKAGLRVLVGRFNAVFYGQKIKEPLFCAYFSLKPQSAKIAYEAEKIGDRKTFGKLLGYPFCCVNSFMENCGQADRDLTIEALLKTKAHSSFYCNSIFNFESKLKDKSVEIYLRTAEIWRPTQHLFLIKHMPCSFGCKESIKIGQKTLEILKKETPDLAQEVEFALKNPILYFDYFNWLVFDGKIKGNRLKYNRILPYSSLFPKENLNLVKKGNQLAVKEKEISVFRDGKLVGKMKKENKYRGALIDFK